MPVLPLRMTDWTAQSCEQRRNSLFQSVAGNLGNASCHPARAKPLGNAKAPHSSTLDRDRENTDVGDVLLFLRHNVALI